MFKLDDEFLRTLGLGDLPPEDRGTLLRLLYEELELRVGTTLAEGLSDADLDEYESLVEHELGAGTTWLQANDPGYASSNAFERFLESAAASNSRPSEDWLLNEYASLRWLELHRPNYQNVVAEHYDVLREMVAQYRDRLLDRP